MTKSQRWYFVRCLVGFLLLGILSSPPVTAGEPLKSQSPRQNHRLLAQADPAQPGSAESPGPQQLPPGGTSVEDLLLQKGTITMDEWIQIRAEQEYKGAENSRRIDGIEDWKTRTELLPILRDKVNFGLNALQFLYTHQDAKVPEGKSQDNFSIRRSEILFWGRISDTLPRWHALMEFQSINFGRETPTGGSGAATGQPVAATFFRESYIDFRPVSVLGALFELHPHGHLPNALRHLHRNFRRSSRCHQFALSHIGRTRPREQLPVPQVPSIFCRNETSSSMPAGVCSIGSSMSRGS